LELPCPVFRIFHQQVKQNSRIRDKRNRKENRIWKDSLASQPSSCSWHYLSHWSPCTPFTACASCAPTSVSRPSSVASLSPWNRNCRNRQNRDVTGFYLYPARSAT